MEAAKDEIPETVSPKQAAGMSPYSVFWVYKMIRLGYIRAYRPGGPGGHLQVDVESLKERLRRAA